MSVLSIIEFSELRISSRDQGSESKFQACFVYNFHLNLL